MPFNFPIEQNRFGDLFAQGISNAINTYSAGKQRNRENTLQDQSIAQNKSLFEFAHPGFHFTAPTDVLPVQQKVVETPGIQRTPTGSGSDSIFQRMLGPAIASGSTDRYNYGSGYYVDKNEEDEDLRRKAAFAGASEFQKALLTAAGTAQGNPAQTNYRTAQAAQINYNLAHPKPLPPDPRAVHAANRDYDVSHPLPTPPQSQFVFPTGTDSSGKPIVLRGNTKTGAIGPTDIGRPQTGQAGEREGAQIAVAQNQVTSADKIMRDFEDKLLSGQRTISTSGAAAAKAALGGGALVSSTAEATLNKLDPDLAGYVRAAKAVAAAERLITPRGGSNSLSQIEGMLSAAGPHANADLINQAREYRKALVGGLQSHGSPAPSSGTSLQQKYDAAYGHLKSQGKADPDIKALIGERP